MYKLSELNQERSKSLDKMKSIVEKAIAENRSKNDEETKMYSLLDDEVRELDEKINLFKQQDELDKRSFAPVVKTDEKKSISEQFRSAINDANTGKMTSFKVDMRELRAEPLISTSVTQQNVQLGGVSIVKQDAKSFLAGLGVKTYTGVKGQITLTSAAQVSATFPGENTTDVSANFTPAMLTLAPRRCGISQTYTKEFLANVNDEIVTDVMTELQDAIWRKLAEDLMTNLYTDAKDSSTLITGSTLAATDIYALEAGISAAPKAPAFVTSPKVAGFLKGTATIASVAGPIWNGNPYAGSIDGIAAYGTPYAGGVTAEKLIYGDWTEAAVATFGPVEITINPYTYAKEGKIEVVVDTMADTGVINYRAFKWINDVSIA